MTSGIGPSDSTPQPISMDLQTGPASDFSNLQSPGGGQTMSSTDGFQNTLTQAFVNKGATPQQAQQASVSIIKSMMMDALQSLQQFAKNAMQQQKENEQQNS
ncbi:MAG: hypothetical protein JSR97_09685 [Verrucomicrobia bacterium]|nr:hypothetical protein [Verrucomicrobiota bacterium]